MANQEHTKYPHLIVTGTAQTELYVPPKRGGKEFELPKRKRQAHGKQLLSQLDHLRQEANELGREQKAFGVDIGNGLLLQFESDPGFDLKIESLEFLRSGIELFNVKQEDEKTLATVFVPEGKIARYVNLVTKYLQEDTPKGNPKNRTFVESIAGIRRAVLEALWTDDPRSLSTSDTEEIWWEVWLRVGDDRDADLDAQAKINLDNESKELILVGQAYAITGEAGQIYRQYTNSDHGIDGEIEFKDYKGKARRVCAGLCKWP